MIQTEQFHHVLIFDVADLFGIGTVSKDRLEFHEPAEPLDIIQMDPGVLHNADLASLAHGHQLAELLQKQCIQPIRLIRRQRKAVVGAQSVSNQIRPLIPNQLSRISIDPAHLEPSARNAVVAIRLSELHNRQTEPSQRLNDPAMIILGAADLEFDIACHTSPAIQQYCRQSDGNGRVQSCGATCACGEHARPLEDADLMALLKKKDIGQAAWFFRAKPAEKTIENGWRFSLKGSPRHYDDVNKIIAADPGARVYFTEALTYERGAGVALWRIEATSFDWLTRLYAWWVEMERVEPIQFTFYLYLPENPKYAELDLRTNTPEQVVAVIKEKAPRSEEAANQAARRR